MLYINLNYNNLKQYVEKLTFCKNVVLKLNLRVFLFITLVGYIDGQTSYGGDEYGGDEPIFGINRKNEGLKNTFVLIFLA